MKVLPKKIILVIGLAILLAIAGWCCFKIFSLSNRHGEIRKDYSLVNNISIGLLSVDEWRENFITVMNNQLDDFELTKGQRDTLEQEVEEMLHGLIRKAADSLLEKKQKSLGGKIKKFIANALIDEKDVHALVPEYSKTIVNELTSEDTKEKLKALAKSKLKEFAATTYDSSGNKQEKVDEILAQYKVSTVEEFNAKNLQRAHQLSGRIYNLTYVAIGIVGVFLLLWWLLRKQKELFTLLFISSVLLALELLLAGLTSQMIEIDARINSLNFHLIGTVINFKNQVIFYQSKSIVDVVRVLLETGKYDSILVGVLILLFSIVFPISKLTSSGLYLLGNERWKKSKLIQFFAFKSGKWSMADVMVIAIFMAYIGFKGILDDQLKHLNVDTDSLTSISTNKTSLQPGYILFIVFVLFSLLLSFILGKITDKHTTKSHT